MVAHGVARKEIQSILDELSVQGWAVTSTSHGHYRAVPPDKTKTIVHLAAATGGPSGLRNALAQLRRCGFVWPPPDRPKPAATEPDVDAAWGDPCFELPVPTNDVASADKEPPVKHELDKLFEDLKHAREYVVLAEDDLRTRQIEAAAAEKKRDAALKEYEAAKEKLRTAKERFDKEFGA